MENENKTKTIYLVRHGQTEFNVAMKAQGWCDSPLTKQGQMQALVLKEYFHQQNIDFAAAYCSDLPRAVHTMQLIAQPQTRMYAMEGLREVSFGKLDGADKKILEMIDHDTRVSKYGAEPYESAISRALSSLYYICRNEEADPVLAVSHSAILLGIYLVLEKREGMPEEIEVPNGTILQLEFDAQKLRVRKVMYIS